MEARFGREGPRKHLAEGSLLETEGEDRTDRLPVVGQGLFGREADPEGTGLPGGWRPQHAAAPPGA